MIEILKIWRCQWRNSYAPAPVLAADLALGEAWSWTAASLPEPAIAALREKLPDLHITATMDAADLIAKLAQQFQSLADVTVAKCGVHARDEANRTATIFFSCRDEYLADAVLSLAVQLVNFLIKNELTAEQLIKLRDRCISLTESAGLDQSTRLMMEEAGRRDIPWFRISRLTRHMQLGQGVHTRRTFETLRSAESPVGRDLSRNKLTALHVLKQIGLPVGHFAAVHDVNSALKAAEDIGYPIVLKPTMGKQGTSVYANLLNAQELRGACAKTAGKGQFLVQSFFPGEDLRLLIVAGRLVAAGRRTAAYVTGDGKHTIMELVERTNLDPRRAEVFDRIVKPIVLDHETDRALAHQGLARNSVPAAGQYVRLRLIANSRTGGGAEDVTDIIHPDNAAVAIKAAKALELTVAGVDFIVGDVTKSWREVGGGICEVNSVVGLRVHMLANPKRDVTGPIIETIYPNRQNGRIPTAVIAGTGGGEALILKNMLARAGHVVGLATAEGVQIGGENVISGDHATNDGAAMVLRDPTVTAAVLEISDTELLEAGMYLDHCDVAALTREQAKPMRKVLEAASKAVVLNAEDPFCAAKAQEFGKSVRTILFAQNDKCAALLSHMGKCGDAVFVTAGGNSEIVIATGKTQSALLANAELPLHNIPGALAAAAIALGLGLTHDQIQDGLKSL